jgi:hypothetical protein
MSMQADPPSAYIFEASNHVHARSSAPHPAAGRRSHARAGLHWLEVLFLLAIALWVLVQALMGRTSFEPPNTIGAPACLTTPSRGAVEILRPCRFSPVAQPRGLRQWGR